MDLKSKILFFIGIFLSLFVCINVNATDYEIDNRGLYSNFLDGSDKLNALHNLVNDLSTGSDVYIFYINANAVRVYSNISHIQYGTQNINYRCNYIVSNGGTSYVYNSDTKDYELDTTYNQMLYSSLNNLIYSSNDILYDSAFLGSDYNYCSNVDFIINKSHFDNYSWEDNLPFSSYNSTYYLYLHTDEYIPSYVKYAYPSWLSSSVNTYSYTINYYFDNQLDNSKTYIGSINAGDTISNYDRYSSNIYSLNQSYTFIASQDNLTFNVYYISSVPYTINYYFDNQLDNSKTYNGTGQIGSTISNYDRYSSDDVLLSGTYNFVLQDSNNVFNVYYISAEYSLYTIEYYFDGILDNSKTETLRARVGSIIDSFTDYSSDSYVLIDDNDYTITIQSDSELNLLRIFYESVPVVINDDIDTSSSDFYLFYNFDDIKRMFPSIDFDSMSHFQKLAITIGFNILFLLFIVFITYYVLKILFRVIQWFI